MGFGEIQHFSGKPKPPRHPQLPSSIPSSVPETQPARRAITTATPAHRPHLHPERPKNEAEDGACWILGRGELSELTHFPQISENPGCPPPRADHRGASRPQQRGGDNAGVGKVPRSSLGAQDGCSLPNHRRRQTLARLGAAGQAKRRAVGRETAPQPRTDPLPSRRGATPPPRGAECSGDAGFGGRNGKAAGPS